MASSNGKQLLAEQARALFSEHAARLIPELAAAIGEALSAMEMQAGSSRQMQDRRDAVLAYKKGRDTWVKGAVAVISSGRGASAGGAVASKPLSLSLGKLELMGDEAVETSILSSRLALRLLDFSSWELNDLRLRIQNLEGLTELSKQDIFRPEVLAQHLVDQWVQATLSQDIWVMVQDIIQKSMGEHMLKVYHATNEFLISHGIMAEIDLRPLVKRTPSGHTGGGTLHDRPEDRVDSDRAGLQPPAARAAQGMAPGGAAGRMETRQGGLSHSSPLPDHGGWDSDFAGQGQGAGQVQGQGQGQGHTYGQNYGSSPAGARGPSGTDPRRGATPAMPGGQAGRSGAPMGGNGSSGNTFGQGGHPAGRPGQTGASTGGGAGQVAAGRGPQTIQGSSLGAPSSGSSYASGRGWEDRHGVHDETRMQTATSPLARAKMRAQGVMGHLKRLLSNQVPGFDDTRAEPPSPQLARAMASAQHSEQAAAQATLLAGAQAQVYAQVHVDQAVGNLRRRTTALKEAASTNTEKATIEIVALMFQAILAEDRIPAGVRVWFARLQMPVLRVAMAEPEFFGSLQHPARRLIDRMGSCALGFDVTVAGGVLEQEIKRVVQVIEQYPETGRRVFQLVYDEFDKFLSRFLAEQGGTARVVSIAQQIEQKETMAIQYTIQLRSMLDDISVRDEIREFLFKVWAEVMALSAMKNGPQHAETMTFKRAATDLVGAASAKPNREDRAQVIAELPALLRTLRRGMALLSLDVPEQDQHLKILSSTLADAFMSKTHAIPVERIDAMAKRLANLEDYLSDEDVGDLPLDTESLVMMIGIDATDIVMISDGGSQPSDAMRAWAKELQLGSWYTLDHSGKTSHVQFVWCSDRKQLHLFATVDGHNFLIQARRLAAYLQAGLLLPMEEEALTVRATRDALAKLDANPERLLS